MKADRLTPLQLQRLEKAFCLGADDASLAMARWLSVPSLIAIESVEQYPLVAATSVLSDADEAVCFCVMAINGSLTGQLILCFDDTSGLSLADLLLNNPPGTATEWGDVERSAALESHNIIGCAYLNSLARHLLGSSTSELKLIPSPPEFRRDFAECLLESVFVDQAMVSDFVFVAKARFELRGQPLHWTLLLVPDTTSMITLRGILSQNAEVEA